MPDYSDASGSVTRKLASGQTQTVYRHQPDKDPLKPFVVPPHLVRAAYHAMVQWAARTHRIQAAGVQTWLDALIEEHRTLETLQNLVPIDLDGDREPSPDELFERLYGPLTKGI